MIDRAAKSGWFVLGIVLGMLLCVMLVVQFGPSMSMELERYVMRTLASPPWVEPQVCYLAKIHEGNPGQECTPEGPTTEASWLAVSRDTIFHASLMFAGLVLFGSVFLRKVVPAERTDRWYRKAAAICLFEGTFILAALHVFFAGTGELYHSRRYYVAHNHTDGRDLCGLYLAHLESGKTRGRGTTGRSDSVMNSGYSFLASSHRSVERTLAYS